MKFAQFALLIAALIVAIASTAEGKATQNVRWNKKVSGRSTWFNGHDLKAVSFSPLPPLSPHPTHLNNPFCATKLRSCNFREGRFTRPQNNSAANSPL